MAFGTLIEGAIDMVVGVSLVPIVAQAAAAANVTGATQVILTLSSLILAAAVIVHGYNLIRSG
jgi:hypothetical protein